MHVYAADLLRAQAERCLRKLLEEIAEISEEEAFRDRHPHWPGQRWGFGQDGSIAGIVRHVAYWKQRSLSCLSFPASEADAQKSGACVDSGEEDWSRLRESLRAVGKQWNAGLRAAPDSAFAQEHLWEGQPWRLGDIVLHLIEHDIQHAAQIAYLRQRHRAEAVLAGTRAQEPLPGGLQ